MARLRRGVREWMEHLFNPVHVYCRLVDMGLSRNRAMTVCVRYERSYRWLVGIVPPAYSCWKRG